MKTFDMGSPNAFETVNILRYSMQKYQIRSIEIVISKSIIYTTYR